MADSKTITRSSSLPESLVDAAQVLTASKALVDYIKKASKEEVTKTGKRNLLAAAGDDDDEEEAGVNGADTPVWLTFSTKRHIVETNSLQPNKIAVPHPLNSSANDSETTICLITADPQRAYKNIIADDAFPAELRARITRVIDLTHLTKKFKSYEAQRKLFAEHDLFLGDERIITRLPKVLGKTFYKTTTKRPVPVTLNKRRARGADGKAVKTPKKAKKPSTVAGQVPSASEMAEYQALAMEQANETARTPEQIANEIKKAIGSAVVHLGPSPSTAVRVGLAGWPAAHIAANVEAVCREVVGKYVPQKWNGVRSIFLKGPRTMALPIWQTDELWVEGSKDVLKNGSEELKSYEARQAAKREKANVGKKRKAVAEAEEAEKAEKAEKTKTAAAEKAVEKVEEKKERPAKKAKQAADNSGKDLDKQIAAQKEKLKKQKAAAKKAMGI